MFTNQQPISDDEILPTSSVCFRDVRVRERPIPSFPRILVESKEHPTIDTETDPPKSGNAGVSTMPCNSPTSFLIKLFFITTDDSFPDFSLVDGEITIGLVSGDSSILLSDIVSMLFDTIASLGDLTPFVFVLPSADLSMSEKSIHFNDTVEFVNENTQLPKSWILLSSLFALSSTLYEVISSVFKSSFLFDGSPVSSINLCAISTLSPMYVPSGNDIDTFPHGSGLEKSEFVFKTEERRFGEMGEFKQVNTQV
ncbi:hypothetical protein BLNAU_6092 [Blattamonas nauphoetae]|uniref:Uncharacterized protein n=1 Tax=Blattamonas nauphoetae TaxID=2049346 RepID=A0ABQ9Y521_9EUKA|nr:hypothetical protein BLNAU_6092 [Blattamonas nauphoetae]